VVGYAAADRAADAEVDIGQGREGSDKEADRYIIHNYVNFQATVRTSQNTT